MRLYRHFGYYDASGTFNSQNPVSLSAVTKTTADVTVQTLTPAQDTTYHAVGHYYAATTDSSYSSDSQYKIVWTYEMVLGTIQTVTDYFRTSSASSSGTTGAAFAIRYDHPRAVGYL